MPPPPPPPGRVPSPSSSKDGATSSSPEPEAGPSTAPPPTPPPTPPEDVPNDQSRDSATNTPNCPFFLQGHCPNRQTCLFGHDEFVAWLQERQELTLPEIDTPPAQSQDTSPQVAPPSETNGAATGAATGTATVPAAVPTYGAAAIVTYGAEARAAREAAARAAREAAAVAAARAAAEAAKANPPVVRRPPIVGSTCRSVAVSWPKPGKVAILCYGSLDMAKDECSKFNGHSSPAGQRKMVCGHEVAAILSAAARPAKAPQTARVSSQVAVFFGPSVKTADEKLRRSIRKNLTPGPRQVRMGEYTATEGETIAAVRSLLEAIAPLELFQVKQDSTKTRLEAIAWFPDLVAALEASRRLDKTCLPFCAEAELSVRVHNINDTCSFRCHKRK